MVPARCVLVSRLEERKRNPNTLLLYGKKHYAGLVGWTVGVVI
jgi:hypothetical protein